MLVTPGVIDARIANALPRSGGLDAICRRQIRCDTATRPVRPGVADTVTAVSLAHIRIDDPLGRTVICERVGVPPELFEEITAGCVNVAHEGMGDNSTKPAIGSANIMMVLSATGLPCEVLSLTTLAASSMIRCARR